MLTEFDTLSLHSLPRSPEEDKERRGAGQILTGVFEALDRAAITYCVLHGYERFSDHVTSDIDCLIDPAVRSRQLLALFHREKTRIGAEVVHCNGRFFVLAGRNADGSPCLVMLDFYTAGEADGLVYSPASDVLKHRQRLGQFWIPATGHEFALYLARTIAKRRLDEERTRRLSELYSRDPKACETCACQLWGGHDLAAVFSAAESGDWQPVYLSIDALCASLRKQAMRRFPAAMIGRKLIGLYGRIDRLIWPPGLNVVFLGPDGAGKSSLIEALESKMTCIFPRSVCWGFVPHLRRLLRRPQRSTSEPHALPPRSLPTSLLRAAWWFSFNTLNFARLRWTKARSTLVLNDRHFIDILVDPTRYRYGGPQWLLPLIWKLSPNPDLVVLLDAPAEVLQARKQELPFEVTARQRKDYLALVKTLNNGHIVDAAQAAGTVANDVSALIVKHLSNRNARRHRLN